MLYDGGGDTERPDKLLTVRLSHGSCHGITYNKTFLRYFKLSLKSLQYILDSCTVDTDSKV